MQGLAALLLLVAIGVVGCDDEPTPRALSAELSASGAHILFGKRRGLAGLVTLGRGRKRRGELFAELVDLAGELLLLRPALVERADLRLSLASRLLDLPEAHAMIRTGDLLA